MHFEYLDKVMGRPCEGFSNNLFRGYAQYIFFPERALEDLEKARDEDPTSHLALLCYAHALGSAGSLKLDAEQGLAQISEAIEYYNVLRHYLPENQSIVSELTADCIQAASRCRELGMLADAEEYEVAARKTYGLIAEDDSDGLQNRAACQFYWRQDDSVLKDFHRSDLRNRVHNQQALWAAVVHYRRGDYDHVEYVLQSTDREFQKSVAGLRALLMLDKMKSRDDLRVMFASMAGDRNGLGAYNIFDWIVHRMAKDEEKVALAASEVRHAVQRLGKPGWEAWADFMCEDINAETLLDRCEDRFSLAYAHFFIAFDELARGNRLGAEHHFQQVVETKRFQLYAYLMSKVFLERLEGDATGDESTKWLEWLDDSQNTQ